MTDHWPLAALRLQTPRLELRPPDDGELAVVADVALTGIHPPDQRPFLTPWTHLPPRQRALFVIQQHWLARAQWQPEAWNLELYGLRLKGVGNTWKSEREEERPQGEE